MIGFLKLILIFVLRFFCRILCIFPIKNDRIVFFSYKGTQYSCSPMYISEFLVNQSTKLEIIWFFDNLKKYEYLKAKGYKMCKYKSIKRVYYELTAKVCVNNVGTYSWIPLRKGQIHMNTWHGGGAYKRCGLGEINNNHFMKKTIELSARETNCFISSCDIFTNKVLKDDFNYNGFVLNSGLPKNDVFFDNSKIKESIIKVNSFYNISSDCFTILYAPTWRYSQFDYKFDFERVLNCFSQKTGKKCVLLYRYHHLASTSNNLINNENVIDATHYPNMQDLLCFANVLITDYSSCIWDFCLMNKNIFIYAPDLKSYTKNRGFHVMPQDFGFSISESVDDLIQKIDKTDLNENIANSIKHVQIFGSFEDGSATERVGKYILEALKK